MLEIFQKEWILNIVNAAKATIFVDIATKNIMINDLDVVHPWEFEKSGILLEVKEYGEDLFYSFTVDGRHVLVLFSDNFELKEEILSFFGDVDILILPGSQASVKIFENIEARLVIPYGAWKQTFLSHAGQHIDPTSHYKVKADFSLDTTEFVNLEETN